MARFYSPIQANVFPSLLKFVCGYLGNGWLLDFWLLLLLPQQSSTGKTIHLGASMELWFLGQGYHDHLEKDVTCFGWRKTLVAEIGLPVMCCSMAIS